jgi:hypothetical protein
VSVTCSPFYNGQVPLPALSCVAPNISELDGCCNTVIVWPVYVNVEQG